MPEGAIPAVRAFQKELAPSFIDHACIMNGFAPPPGSPLGEGMGAGFAYCELHCGSAVTATLLAASNPLGDFHVIDARAPMIESGRALAKEGQVRNIAFHEMGVEAALDRTFPAFDYIVANGIYTWVPLRERALILAFVRKFLKPGGALYLSYNARPGWNRLDSFRRIFREALRGRSVDAREGLGIARDIYAQLHAAKSPEIVRAGPAPSALSFLEDLPAELLIADYANEFAEPLYVTEVAADFAAIDCVLAGSAEMADSAAVLMNQEPYKSLLPNFPTAAGRELAKDFLRDTLVRRDVFVRGGKRVAADSSDVILRGLAFALEQPAADVRYEKRMPFAELRFDSAGARALVAALAAGPRTLGELVEQMRGNAEEAQTLIANVHALLLSGQARPVYRGSHAAAETARTLSAAIRARATGSEAIGFLPSSYGTAFPVPVPDQLFMGMAGTKSAEDRAEEASTQLTQRKSAALLNRARAYPRLAEYYRSLGLV